jgi:uncharacterized protein YbjT (DUF2867 family)
VPHQRTSQRTYVLLGASGLVGGALQKLLAADPAYKEGTLLSRRVLGLDTPNVHDIPGPQVRDLAVDFNNPGGFGGQLAVDDVFCCLGTTIKKAGSQEQFHKVDCDIPLGVAREARARGARQFLIVTAVGADPKSGVFYNRVKGEVEAGLRELGFPGGLKVFRPSLIVGDRAERRPAESVAMAVMSATRPLFAGGLAKYRAIDAVDVARAMQHAATQTATPGSGERRGDGESAAATAPVTIYEGRSLFEQARSR